MAPPGFKQGTLGSNLPPTKPTVWKAGGTTTVSWGIMANHGGGCASPLTSSHSNVQLPPKLAPESLKVPRAIGPWLIHGAAATDQYRLCKKGRNLTEACFQQMPLEPATATHEIVYGPLTPNP
jgi:hypothetical protein